MSCHLSKRDATGIEKNTHCGWPAASSLCTPLRNRQLELCRYWIWKRQLNQLLSGHFAIDYKDGVIICHYFCLCARLASIDEDGRFSKAMCARVSVWAGVDTHTHTHTKQGGKWGERALTATRSVGERRDVCVKTRDLMKFRKRDGRSSPPCRDIAAVALCINFCRQSALAAEAGCMDQNRISTLWQYKVSCLKLDCFWSFEQKFCLANLDSW